MSGLIQLKETMLFVYLLPFSNNCLYHSETVPTVIKIIAGLAFATFCVGNFPTTSGIALLVGFFGGRTINQFLANHFVNDFSNHFFVVAMTVGLIFYSTPLIAQGVFSAIGCAWIGSHFKVYLRQEMV